MIGKGDRGISGVAFDAAIYCRKEVIVVDLNRVFGSASLCASTLGDRMQGCCRQLACGRRQEAKLNRREACWDKNHKAGSSEKALRKAVVIPSPSSNNSV